MLLALNIYGLFVPAYKSSVIKTESTAADYFERSITPKQALASFAELKRSDLSPEAKINKLFLLVSSSFVHDAQSYKLRVWDNWYLWLKAQTNPLYFDSQDANLLWQRGAGFCHQAAIIFATKARELGVESALVWLDGHVITEVNIPGVGVRAADPDMGILWNDSLPDMINYKGEVIKKTYLEHGYTERLAEKISRIYLSKDNNRYTAVPYLPMLYKEEVNAAYIKWLVPLAFLAIVASQLGYSRLTKSEPSDRNP